VEVVLPCTINSDNASTRHMARVFLSERLTQKLLVLITYVGDFQAVFFFGIFLVERYNGLHILNFKFLQL